MEFVRASEDSTVRLAANNIHECMNIQDKTIGGSKTRIGPFEIDFVMSTRQIHILNSLKNYYDTEVVESLLLPMINQTTPVSLRALDWLVTNYSKKHNVTCRSLKDVMFNIHHGYKTALNINKRRNFDPFRRRMRLKVHYKGGTAESTVGQLNFLQWAQEYGVLKYLTDNLDCIDQEMNETTKTSRQRKKQGLTRRSELSKAPSARCMVYNVQSRVAF